MSIPRDFFLSVSKPARYTGGEINQIKKDPTNVRLKFALCFPDIYEIGMSHIGGKILYKLLNDSDDIMCERVFAPYPDAKGWLLSNDYKLFSLESRLPLNQFDIVGFSIEYELSYSTIIEMLRLGGIEPLSDRRGDDAPLLIAGGPSVFNPEPVAGLFDLFYVGDGEASLLGLCQRYLELKEGGKGRKEIIERLSEIDGVYAPSLINVEYDGLYLSSLPGKTIRKVTAPSIEGLPYPTSQIMPNIEIVQDRFVVEIQRGCTHGCRFCFAGYIYRPIRQRSMQGIYDLVVDALLKGGFKEVSFLSLSVGDYCGLDKILSALNDRFSSKKIGISLPSLRVDTATPELVKEISRVKKTGLTIAPEVGSERMRQKINKNISEKDILKAVEVAFSEGWELIKLYFMIGLPEEEESDIEAIVALSYKILDTAKRFKKRPDINITISQFVPKPHTALQWDCLEPENEIRRKLDYLQKGLSHPAFKIKKVNPSLSIIEALLSRGDRRVLDIILGANRRGAYLDAWTDNFDISRYLESGQEFTSRYSLRIEDYLSSRDMDRLLPWEFISAGVDRGFLINERARYRDGIRTDDCLIDECSACGVCDFEKISNKKDSSSTIVAAPPAKIENRRDATTYYRVRYTKEGDAIYCSHLDTINIFVRALLMSNLPLIFRGAFNPRVEISFGPALPIGILSTTEFTDFPLAGHYSRDDIKSIISRYLPLGMAVEDVVISPRRFTSISKTITAARYDIFSPVSLQKEKIEWILKSDSILIVRNRHDRVKEIDIRRFIHNIKSYDDSRISIYLLYKDGSTAGIMEVLGVLGLEKEKDIIIRKDRVYFSEREIE